MDVRELLLSPRYFHPDSSCSTAYMKRQGDEGYFNVDPQTSHLTSNLKADVDLVEGCTKLFR